MDTISEFTEQLYRAQGRKIDDLILAKMRAGRSLYEKVALQVEVRTARGWEGPVWVASGMKVTSDLSVRVSRKDLSWVEFQRRARALRDAGVL